MQGAILAFLPVNPTDTSQPQSPWAQTFAGSRWPQRFIASFPAARHGVSTGLLRLLRIKHRKKYFQLSQGQNVQHLTPPRPFSDPGYVSKWCVKAGKTSKDTQINIQILYNLMRSTRSSWPQPAKKQCCRRPVRNRNWECLLAHLQGGMLSVGLDHGSQLKSFTNKNNYKKLRQRIANHSTSRTKCASRPHQNIWF